MTLSLSNFVLRTSLLLAALTFVPQFVGAQRSRVAAPVAPAATAQLEVVADSAGQPIRINGAQVGVTPAVLQVPAAASARVEVGAGSRARAITMDLPAQGRIRVDVTMPRDTQPVPVLRSVAELERDLDFATRLQVPKAPVRPVRPRAPGLGKSVIGGVLLAGASAALGAAVCEQTFKSPEPSGGYVGGTYYAPGTYSLGTSTACVGMLGGGVLIGGTLSLHQWRRLSFQRATRAYGAADSRWQADELAYRDAVARRAEAVRAELARAQGQDVERRRSVLARNEQILRANRELPLVTFLNAPGARVAGARTTLVPPGLRIVSLAFQDADGDSVVAAGERASVVVRVANEGKGAAYDVRVNPKTPTGLRSAPQTVGTIAPWDTVEARVEFSAAGDVADGQAALEIEALEANGFDADPFLLRVPTLAYRAPELAITDVGVEDPQGRSVITPGISVVVTVRVQNRGGPADSVTVVLERGDSTLLFTSDPSSPRAVERLGRMRAGETRDVTVDVIANRRATGFPLRASATEATGRYGAASRDLGLTLNTPQRAVAQLEVLSAAPAGAAAATAAAIPALGSALLAGIPTARTTNPDAFAVIIGNRSYTNAPSVTYAANDAAVVRQYAEKALGIRPGNIIELTDATKSTLEDLFGVAGNPNGRLKDLVIPGRSEVFVFYSGHGAPDPQAERAYLMPVDANANRLGITGYSLDLLYDNLAALNAKHVTVVLDACFSGGSAGGEMLITAASPIGIRVNDPSARFAGRNATVIAAATGQQLANWYPEQRHGMLTYFFLKGLQGSADRDGDGRISVGEMKSWLQEGQGLPYEARRLFSRPQTPQVFGDPLWVIR